MTSWLGAAFAEAVVTKDHERLRELLHEEVDFRGMTPGRVWEADTPEDVVGVLRTWFDDGDIIEAVENIETDSFADRERVGYRMRVRNGDGLQLVEQQAYLTPRDDRIGWIRILCAGYRAVSEDLTPDQEAQENVHPRSPASATGVAGQPTG
jgi:hypothetical protein